jgi:hypothetical protein
MLVSINGLGFATFAVRGYKSIITLVLQRSGRASHRE